VNPLVSKAVDLHDRLAIGLVVAVLVRDEKQIRRGDDPHAAEPHLEPRDVIQLVIKDGSLVEAAVAIRVFEDEDPVAPSRFPIWIGIVLGDPDPPAVVEAQADRLADVRLAREERYRESLGHLQGLDRLQRSLWLFLSTRP